MIVVEVASISTMYWKVHLLLYQTIPIRIRSKYQLNIFSTMFCTWIECGQQVLLTYPVFKQINFHNWIKYLENANKERRYMHYSINNSLINKRILLLYNSVCDCGWNTFEHCAFCWLDGWLNRINGVLGRGALI